MIKICLTNNIKYAVSIVECPTICGKWTKISTENHVVMEHDMFCGEKNSKRIRAGVTWKASDG